MSDMEPDREPCQYLHHFICCYEFTSRGYQREVVFVLLILRGVSRLNWGCTEYSPPPLSHINRFTVTLQFTFYFPPSVTWLVLKPYYDNDRFDNTVRGLTPALALPPFMVTPVNKDYVFVNRLHKNLISQRCILSSVFYLFYKIIC